MIGLGALAVAVAVLAWSPLGRALANYLNDQNPSPEYLNNLLERVELLQQAVLQQSRDIQVLKESEKQNRQLLETLQQEKLADGNLKDISPPEI